jgi:amidophosphoribosyltransferase
MNSLREACGVFGVFGQTDGHAALTTYYGLYALQHRGQESCGIVVNDDGLFRVHKDLGLVGEVITPRVLSELGLGSMASGTCASARRRQRPCERADDPRKPLEGPSALAHKGTHGNAISSGGAGDGRGTVFHTTTDRSHMLLVIRERIHAPPSKRRVLLPWKTCRALIPSASCLPQAVAVRDGQASAHSASGRPRRDLYRSPPRPRAWTPSEPVFIREVGRARSSFSPRRHSFLKEHCGKARPCICVFEYIYYAGPIPCWTANRQLRPAACGAFLAWCIPYRQISSSAAALPDSGIDAASGMRGSRHSLRHRTH